MAATTDIAQTDRQPIPSEDVERTRDTSSPTTDTATAARNLETCCICLAPVTSATRAVAAPCLHACFDFSCLVTWLEGSSGGQNSCPVCKQAVETVKYGFDADGKGFDKYRVKQSSSSKPHASGSLHRRAESRRRSTARTTTSYPSGSSSTTAPADDIARRRFVYKHRLRSLHIGVNRKSRFANYSPRTVRTDRELAGKARAFARRELEVFEWTAGSREWLVEYVVAVVKSMQLRGPDGRAEELLAEFLGREFAGVFVHELHAYLRSPFVRIRDYDAWAQYAMTVEGEEKALLEEGAGTGAISG
ncbi:hypothetical protein DRE_05419 [Drechslerella stenobrocha 248]|uniref:RING-type E3 ubiquitin transferase n=1 Tax=Drechslerella stenobrocha 248 TaxID=1043628 RepID=W7HNF1_9PEZI|nr:hypothetical protein DRE_05419 [Drechslerella stenobrocha 248]